MFSLLLRGTKSLSLDKKFNNYSDCVCFIKAPNCIISLESQGFATSTHISAYSVWIGIRCNPKPRVGGHAGPRT